MILPSCSAAAGGCSQAGPLPSPSPAWLQPPPLSSLKTDSSGIAIAPACTATGAVGGSVVTATTGGQRVSCACVYSPRS